jgi:hypothetical protein
MHNARVSIVRPNLDSLLQQASAAWAKKMSSGKGGNSGRVAPSTEAKQRARYEAKKKESVTVGTFDLGPKGKNDTLLASVTVFDGKPGVDLRGWYAGRDGQMLPGQQGIRLNLEHWSALSNAAGDITEALQSGANGETQDEEETEQTDSSEMNTGDE